MYTLFNRILVFIMLLLGTTFFANGSDTLEVARSRFWFDHLSMNNIWSNSSNPAGNLLFRNFKSINIVETGYSYNNKEVNFPGEPGIANSFYVRARGFKKIDKLIFSGSFGYENDHYNDLLFNNTMVFDPDNPYLLGDTIGGRQRKEGFALKGSVAYPVSEKLLIGIDADYQNYVGAKTKDPRNMNDISSMIITPGIIYSNGNISAGISGGPEIFNDEVSITVMEDAKYNLMQFLGFGYFKSIRNVLTYSSAYFGKGFRTEGQFRFMKGKYSNFSVFGYRHYTEEVRYGGSFRLIDGISDRTTFAFDNYQVIKRDNRTSQINTSFNLSYLYGSQINQRFKSILDGAYSYDSLITESWVERKHITARYSGQIEYILSGNNTNLEETYRFNLGISARYETAAHYPVQNYGSQTISNIMIYTGYRKYLFLNSITILPELGIGYRKNLSSDLKYVVMNLSLPEFQEQDFLARSSDFVRANASLTVLKKTGKKRIPEYFVSINSVYTLFPGISGAENTNMFINGSLGLIF